MLSKCVSKDVAEYIGYQERDRVWAKINYRFWEWIRRSAGNSFVHLVSEHVYNQSRKNTHKWKRTRHIHK